MAFERFPRLPAELRLQVWEMAIEPEEELRPVVFLKPRPNARHLIHGYTVPTRAPALLHVCSVSRRIGCGVYKKAFRDGDRYLWVNFDRDVIQVECFDFKKAFPEYTKIKHLRGVCSDPHDEGARERFRIGYAISCPRLETYDLLLDGNRSALDWWYSIFEDQEILGRLRRASG
ncbi:hypothetical protein F5X68DRAFT_192594 [Plectosphaerella plurivora]|uniref:2EXR domain-containing protein n=1 Tax=Plectosphaerella plurivora TaxID=936078 RepID=A0A9P9A6M4_9PEZI|nr:hypothetical protein F5X68DRAFT_192594 [Plectosphaerella plurivora]